MPEPADVRGLHVGELRLDIGLPPAARPTLLAAREGVEASEAKGPEPPTPGSSRSLRRTRTQTTAALHSADLRACGAGALGKGRGRPTGPEEVAAPRCLLSFRTSLLSALVTTTVLACLGMLAPLHYYKSRLEDYTQDKIKATTKFHQTLVSRLVNDNVTGEAYSSALTSVRATIENLVKDHVEHEVGSMWVYMQHQRRLSPAWTGKGREERLVLANFSYLQLQAEGGSDPLSLNPYSKWIKVSWQTGEQAACSAQRFSTDALEIFAYDMEGNTTSRTKWAVDLRTGLRREPPISTKEHLLHAHPAYMVQSKVAEQARLRPGGAAGVPARRMWSKLFSFVEDGKLGLSWTSPMAYCGDYSCLEGVVEASITLRYISFYCQMEWMRLAALLKTPAYTFALLKEKSNVFIVNHVSRRDPDQEGLLVGASDILVVNMTMATASELLIVQATALALERKFGQWSNQTLRDSPQSVVFNLAATLRGDAPGTELCEPKGTIYPSDCMRAGTQSVQLDDDTHWLVVVVLPAGAFSNEAAVAERDVQAQVLAVEGELERSMRDPRFAGSMITVGAVVVCLVIAWVLSYFISRRLSALAGLMHRLSNLDFANESVECSLLRLGTRSRIKEVGNLQEAFCRLSRGIEAFAKFVPETVVQNIVRGDAQARSLHVSQRTVTIMFSDIRDFTSISESLRECDLLFLLTHYFSVMTRIVERYEGVVAEILGDGLLVFWNTPRDVGDHTLKACRAALAQQEALAAMNEELKASGRSFPHLEIRIGLHTGGVLSGNIGSEMKMKFGCIGDPVNTASRLEGLCKVYGVSVLCSGEVRAALPEASGLLLRRLDLAQVKGKQTAIEVYEVIAEEALLCDAAGARAEAALYEAALAAYQQARFAEAVGLLRGLVEGAPGDAAAARLLGLALQHLGPDGLRTATDAELATWTGVSAMTEK